MDNFRKCCFCCLRPCLNCLPCCNDKEDLSDVAASRKRRSVQYKREQKISADYGYRDKCAKAKTRRSIPVQLERRISAVSPTIMHLKVGTQGGRLKDRDGRIKITVYADSIMSNVILTVHVVSTLEILEKLKQKYYDKYLIPAPVSFVLEPHVEFLRPVTIEIKLDESFKFPGTWFIFHEDDNGEWTEISDECEPTEIDDNLFYRCTHFTGNLAIKQKHEGGNVQRKNWIEYFCCWLGNKVFSCKLCPMCERVADTRNVLVALDCHCPVAPVDEIHECTNNEFYEICQGENIKCKLKYSKEETDPVSISKKTCEHGLQHIDFALVQSQTHYEDIMVITKTDPISGTEENLFSIKIAETKFQQVNADTEFITKKSVTNVEAMVPAETSEELEMCGLAANSRNTYYMSEIQTIIQEHRLAEIPHGKVQVAVLDSGIKLAHRAFRTFRNRIKTRDFVRSVYDPLDQDIIGHGTACAAIVAANEYDIVSGMKYTGAAPFADLVVCKVITKENSIDPTFVINALKYLKALELQPEIVNMSFRISWNTDEEFKRLQREMSDACQTSVVICAVSNEGFRQAETVAYPAKFGAICIGSCDEYGNRSRCSSIGQDLDFLAVGEGLWCPHTTEEGATAVPVNPLPEECNTLKTFDGTSAAAPLVAGIAAQVLVLAEIWGNTMEEGRGTRLKIRLTNTLRMKEVLKKMASNSKHDHERGYGLLHPREFFRDKDTFIKSLESIP